MAISRRFLLPSSALVIGLVLTATGCGSDSSSESSDTAAPTDTVAPADDVADTAAPEAAGDTTAPEPADTAATEPAPDATTAPVEDGGSSGEVQVTLSDGRAWTLQKDLCIFDPDATGPAAAIINIGGANDDGVEINMIEAWPFDGSTDKGTPFLASFVDENEEVLVFLKDGAEMVGNEVEVAGGYYANVFYEEGDVFDGTYTVRCQP